MHDFSLGCPKLLQITLTSHVCKGPLEKSEFKIGFPKSIFKKILY